MIGKAHQWKPWLLVLLRIKILIVSVVVMMKETTRSMINIWMGKRSQRKFLFVNFFEEKNVIFVHSDLIMFCCCYLWRQLPKLLKVMQFDLRLGWSLHSWAPLKTPLVLWWCRRRTICSVWHPRTLLFICRRAGTHVASAWCCVRPGPAIAIEKLIITMTTMTMEVIGARIIVNAKVSNFLRNKAPQSLKQGY